MWRGPCASGPPWSVLGGVDLGGGLLLGDVEEGGEEEGGLDVVEAVLGGPLGLPVENPGPVGPDEPAEGDALDPGDVGEVLPGELL